MRHTLSVLVENRPGVLTRVSGLFSRRGFNIESLAVSTTDDPKISRMTIVVDGADEMLEQITKQLNKLIDVIKVYDYTDTPVVGRELALIRVNSEQSVRTSVIQVVDIFRGKVVDAAEKHFIIEVTGDSEKIDAVEKMLEPYGIQEMVRTGKIVLNRG